MPSSAKVGPNLTSEKLSKGGRMGHIKTKYGPSVPDVAHCATSNNIKSMSTELLCNVAYDSEFDLVKILVIKV